MIQMITDEKICSKCIEPRKLTDFHKDKGKKDGLRVWCKVCCKKYAEVNKEYHTEATKEWRLNNKERNKETDRIRYNKNKDKPNLRRKAYMENYRIAYKKNNAEKIKTGKKAWAAANRGLVNAYYAQRRARKKQATPAWADKWKIQQYYLLAVKLTKLYGESFVVDHIVPLCGKNVSGLHVETNLQILTAKENLIKSNKFKS